MQYEDLMRDFAKRTLENYNFYIENREVTSLMNFSVSLFLFPKQKFFNSITDSWISSKLLKELKNNTVSNFDESIDLKNICIHIRNGIELFYLKTKIENSKEITELVIEDKACINRQNCGFEITFPIKLLEKFFLEFSRSIINQFAGENN